jgi:hypothetical protein
MKHFMNHDLMAPNVMRIPVDATIVDEFAPLAREAGAGRGYRRYRPSWSSDIRWISADCPETFEQFDSAFDRLGVANHVETYLDLDKGVRLYAGFLHVRSECSETNFHVDWDKTNNEAFTLITPVTDNSNGFGLLYRQLDGTVAEYEYRRGEALIFGDHFIHSTKPGRSEEPVVLLTFNFGTDKMVHWDKIVRTTGRQTAMLRTPDGELKRIDA